MNDKLAFQHLLRDENLSNEDDFKRVLEIELTKYENSCDKYDLSIYDDNISHDEFKYIEHEYHQDAIAIANMILRNKDWLLGKVCHD